MVSHKRLFASVGFSLAALAGNPAGAEQKLTQVFSQNVSINRPAGFEVAFKRANQVSFIQESVPAGETVDRWTQMITLTGAKGLGADPKLTPHLFSAKVAGSYQSDCPGTFSFANLGEGKVDGHDAQTLFLACGIADKANPTFSEQVLVIFIRGSQDYYTVQWAERGAPSSKPMKMDQDKWAARLMALQPIKLID